VTCWLRSNQGSPASEIGYVPRPCLRRPEIRRAYLLSPCKRPPLPRCHWGRRTRSQSHEATSENSYRGAAVRCDKIETIRSGNCPKTRLSPLPTSRQSSCVRLRRQQREPANFPPALSQARPCCPAAQLCGSCSRASSSLPALLPLVPVESDQVFGAVCCSQTFVCRRHQRAAYR